MKALSSILFPAAVMAVTVLGASNLNREAVGMRHVPVFSEARDTVVYPVAGYKLKRNLTLDEISVKDTSSADEDTLAREDTVARISPRDSFKALLDSSLWDKLDSLYLLDSTKRAKEEFQRWYNGLSKQERKAYDNEQKAKKKIAEADSLRLVKEKKQDERDSILEETPRILETFALPDTMQYKRLIAWTVDQDFSKLSVYEPDTTFNYHFYDYPFQRNDVGASWLGVSGSPVQYYNFFNRLGGEGVDFYDAYESWSYSSKTLPHYNTKTPYTELGYFGTLLAGTEMESDNLHIFTTQNITPALNFSLLYNRFGGGGMLENETTTNKTTVAQVNYLGKKYLAHAGFIHHKVTREENGGIVDNMWIRDTTVDTREIRVALTNAESETVKNTFFVDQQLRIPFSFISKMKAKKDSTFKFNADSLDRDITTAFIGHSSEISTYRRTYTDEIDDEYGQAFYNDVFNFGTASADSMRVMKLENKLYIRLQPWSSEGIVSKLDVGAGHYLKSYFDSTSVRPVKHNENSVFLYAGAEGQLKNNFYWDAKARTVVAGHDIGDMDIQANGKLAFYPFRRARKSPVAIGVHFETSLSEPTWYQQHLNLNHYAWDNDFDKISVTRIGGDFEIPHWKLSAAVNYALLSNNLYYDASGIIRQNGTAMSVLSANLDKDLVLGPLHLDNKALFQLSSNETVVPLPKLALNLKYYFQFVVQRDASKTNDILTMQIGANGWWNTKWHSPAYNPDMGVFYNQDINEYNNGPYFDVFLNMQWKRACIFIKYQNAGLGWPMDRADYFSADHYIVTTNGTKGLKIGIWWPFYKQPKGRAPLNQNK